MKSLGRQPACAPGALLRPPGSTRPGRSSQLCGCSATASEPAPANSTAAWSPPAKPAPTSAPAPSSCPSSPASPTTPATTARPNGPLCSSNSSSASTPKSRPLDNDHPYNADYALLPGVTVPLSAARRLPGSGCLPTAGGATVSCSARLAGDYYLGVAWPVPENTFSRMAREQRAHLAGEVAKTITKQVRCRG